MHGVHPQNQLRANGVIKAVLGARHVIKKLQVVLFPLICRPSVYYKVDN